MSRDDQASRLRRLIQEARDTRTIAICSGKGGVSKSNVCLNLSILLSAAGNRVAIVDADLGLANLDVLVDVGVVANLSHVVAGTHRLIDVVVDLPWGVQLVPGASGLAKMAQLSEFQRAQLLAELVTLEADNDIIVIDCGAGIGADTLQFAAAADNVVVVTTPEPTAITDAYAVIKVLSQRDFKGQISLLVNMVTDRHEARRTYERLADVAKRFLGTTVLNGGYMPEDPKVKVAVRERKPFVLTSPQCAASRCLASMASKFCSGGSLVDNKEGFFRRVANWLS